MRLSWGQRVLLRLGDRLQRGRSWRDLRLVPGLVCLLAIRTRLRLHNLYDPAVAADGTRVARGRVPRTTRPERRERTADGSFTDPSDPATGAAHTPFGRLMPLWSRPAPEDDGPSPREVSEALLARNGKMRPAEILNLLAAAWLQFMVHDWLSHGQGDREDTIDVPLRRGDRWPGGQMTVVRTRQAEGTPAPGGPPVYTNTETHWWDGSQLYGSSLERQAAVRAGADHPAKLPIADGMLPEEGDTGIDLTGVSGNWWLGLSLFHTLFAREHNAIVDRLRERHPDWEDDPERLFQTARLVNAAVMAKIHTTEWTLAILPHPTVQRALLGNWHGAIGAGAPRWLRRALRRWEVASGIPGSPRDDHGVPYSITEEFVSVYRMHPLIPDEITLAPASGDGESRRVTMLEMTGRGSRAILGDDRLGVEDLWHSFGVQRPGALRLHNYPESLRRLERPSASGGMRLVDVASIDILRDRERGVPRYNEFRRLLRLAPVADFAELTGEASEDAPTARTLKRLYGEVDRVDLMVGLYAEPLPPGFGFSETAFHIFVLMASRRLKSDPFFTDDYRPEVYSAEGMEWIEESSMARVLTRHLPELQPHVAGLGNLFAPWDREDNRR